MLVSTYTLSLILYSGCGWQVYLQIRSAHSGTKLIDPAEKILFFLVYKQFYPLQAALLAVHPCTPQGA